MTRVRSQSCWVTLLTAWSVGPLPVAPHTPALAEVTGTKPTRTRSSAPTLDLMNLTNINAIVTEETRLNNARVEDAVKAIMMEYCPSLDITQADCDIDSDQVALYRQSPKLVYQQAAREELASSQSWLHPQLHIS